MGEFFIEAESFEKLGGWVVDQQSMESIHSSYIMAHGMGIPVEDAVTNFEIETNGEYQIWALTRDWTAVWNVKEPAGKFQIYIDGNLLDSTLGTNGKDWAWQRAGNIYLSKGKHTLSLHDLTGFNGRCDAIYITNNGQIPSNVISSIDEMRKRLNWQEVKTTSKQYDLIVVGGGVAGICTAISAAREGVSVLLLHDRGVLGGCNSSEIRVCMGGQIHLNPYPNLGNVVKEIAPIMGTPSSFESRYFEDDRKMQVFELLKAQGCDCDVVLNECATQTVVEDKTLKGVITTNTITGKKTVYFAQYFSDCSGDAVLARLCGCTVMYGREPRNAFGETLAPKIKQNLVMGHSIRWYSEEENNPTQFPVLDWNLPFNDENCLNVYNGDWEQETGFSRDMVKEIEYIRDFGLRAIYSNWSFQKNQYRDKSKFAHSQLKWVSPIGGKRESYRVLGDYILKQQDLDEHILHEDGTACITWSIDMHFPEPENEEEFGEPFRSFAYHRGLSEPYSVPYRCLYSKEIDNLFLGGRLISASHIGFASIRVMRTLGMLGEVVGMAVGLCKEHNCKPRQIYSEYLRDFKEKLNKGVEIIYAFQGTMNDHECYHYKKEGWVELRPCSYDKRFLMKFKKDIKKLGLEHKYPLPNEFKR